MWTTSVEGHGGLGLGRKVKQVCQVSFIRCPVLRIVISIDSAAGDIHPGEQREFKISVRLHKI